MASSEDKAAGALEGAGRHRQEDSTSKRTSRKKAQGQSRRRLGEYSNQRSDARALSWVHPNLVPRPFFLGGRRKGCGTHCLRMLYFTCKSREFRYVYRGFGLVVNKASIPQLRMRLGKKQQIGNLKEEV